MKKMLLGVVLCLLSFAAAARADARDAFADKVDLSKVRTISVQHQQTLKTFDTYARDVLFQICGKTSWAGHSAAYTLLDMAFRPETYLDTNILYIRNKPFRQEFDQLNTISQAEQERIKKEGTISLKFWVDPDVQALMSRFLQQDAIKSRAIQEINGQANVLAAAIGFPGNDRPLYDLAILPPHEAPSANAKPWAKPSVVSNAAVASMLAVQNGGPLPTDFAGYSRQVADDLISGLEDARQAWRNADAPAAEAAFAKIAKATQDANPALYPSATKRRFEVLYNSLFRLTLPAAVLYFVGFVFFMLAWRAEVGWLYKSAVGVTLAAWVVHLCSIGIRWWLVQKSVGNWFEAIPIKNQFESVLMSAFFGVTVGLLLERWKRLGIFGAAAAMIGMLSLVAIFSVPYVFGIDIGGAIKQNAGILMTYWLYIHVVLVTASYALIGMTFVMGVWYLVQYLRNDGALVLKTIDDCNLVMLQLAFWILGIGIITGALWADVSWGRPWGWDPKETFALVTWIVYLIIIHIRFVTANTRRAVTTSVLSVVAFFVMLFNWIGVNYFLVGLHSYA